MRIHDASSLTPSDGPDRPPQTFIERRLHEAKHRGDVEGYIRVLAGTYLYVDNDKAWSDDNPGLVRYEVRKDSDAAGSGRTLVVRTAGDLPARRPDLVVGSRTFVKVATAMENDACVVSVNPGSASGMRFPLRDRSRWERTPWDRRNWLRIAEDVPAPVHGDDALITDSTGPLVGEFAHGLACGVHLTVHRREVWNRFDDIACGYDSDRQTLKRDWAVTSASAGLTQLQHLLSYENSPPIPEIALKCRTFLARDTAGALVDVDAWRAYAADVCRGSGFTERAAQAVDEVIDLITMYEERFRVDGMLPPDGWVRTAAAYDYGRAVNFARWVVSARYFEPEELIDTVYTVSKLARESYDSWESYSAGYTLGRVLRFDEGEFGHFYESALTPHRICTQEPESPWHQIPFQLS